MTRSSIFSFGYSIRPRIRSSQAVVALVGHAHADRALVLVGLVLVDEALRLFAAALHAVELERELAVPVEPDPAQRLLDLLGRRVDLAARVRVLDAQPELAALVAGEQPVEERGVDASDVEEAGGARCEADDGRHGVRIVRAVFIGAHVSSAGGIHTAIDRAVEMDADSVQIFTQSPRMWRPTNHPPENFERFKERARGGRPRRRVLPRALPDQSRETEGRPLREVGGGARNTVDVGCAIDADGVVFHIGSHLGAGMDAGLDRVVAAMRVVLDRCSETTWLLMENSAGTGDTIGRSIEELAVVFDRLDGHPRLGVCLDSCHLYASGCDVTDPGALDAVLDELDREIGLDRLRALHVNDSAAPLGSNRDRHANIGGGPARARSSRCFLGQSAAAGPSRRARGRRGRTGTGRTRSEIAKAKKLHRAGVRAAKARARRAKAKS